MTTRTISADAGPGGPCDHCGRQAGTARVLGICFLCWDSGVRRFSDGTTRNEADDPTDRNEPCALAAIIFELDNP